MPNNRRQFFRAVAGAIAGAAAAPALTPIRSEFRFCEVVIDGKAVADVAAMRMQAEQIARVFAVPLHIIAPLSSGAARDEWRHAFRKRYAEADRA
jgi:hypothetical protein